MQTYALCIQLLITCGRQHDLQHWLYGLSDSASYQPSREGQADDINDPPRREEVHGQSESAAAESGQPRDPSNMPILWLIRVMTILFACMFFYIML